MLLCYLSAQCVSVCVGVCLVCNKEKKQEKGTQTRHKEDLSQCGTTHQSVLSPGITANELGPISRCTGLLINKMQLNGFMLWQKSKHKQSPMV